jgi:hypothetical protein
MRRRVGWIVDAIFAAIGGCIVSTLVAVGLVQALIGQRIETLDLWLCDRNVPWWISRHQAVGVRWINGHQNLLPLLGETPLQGPESTEPRADGPEPESWALSRLPSLAGLPMDSRFAALGIGWPMPAFVRTWVVLDPRATFPIPAELDLSAFAMESAITRLGQEGVEALHVRPIGIVVNALPWCLAELWALRLLRARRLSRQAASAAPRAPAA